MEVVIFKKRFLADRKRFATSADLEGVDAVCRSRAFHFVDFQAKRFPVDIRVLCAERLCEPVLVVDVSPAVDHHEELIAAIVLRRVAQLPAGSLAACGQITGEIPGPLLCWGARRDQKQQHTDARSAHDHISHSVTS